VQGRLADAAAFLSAGAYHHHSALNTFQSRGGAPPAAGTTGLYHAAVRYPTRAALARALRRPSAHSVELTGAKDDGANEALYLTDPDGNGLELSWDRPQHEWPRTVDGQLALINLPLDLNSLLELAPADDTPQLWTWTLARIKATTAAPFLLLISPAALVVAWLWLGETPAITALAGGALTLAGVATVQLGARTARPAPNIPRNRLTASTAAECPSSAL
jgi:catechol 2,3-dioxygenase